MCKMTWTFFPSSLVIFILMLIISMVCILPCRGSPPSKGHIENLDRQRGEVPLKFCHVDHGRVSFFSFTKVELPVLP